MKYLAKHINMLTQKGKPFAVIDDQIFVRKSHWITHFGPVSQQYSLRGDQCRELLNKLGGYWVMWPDGFRAEGFVSEWYSVICRAHTTIEDTESRNTRSKLRRGLKNCEVRKVGIREIAENGYECYCAALESYDNKAVQLPPRDIFQKRVMTDEPFQDIRHQWAVYHQEKIIAFAQNLIYDKIEVDYTLIKFHPEYMKLYPSYALIYKMNEYYLEQEGFEYVNDGFRSISHDTGIQEFLIRKFGFEKAYTNLHIHYRPVFGMGMKLSRPFRGIISRQLPASKPVFELDRVAVGR